MKQALARTLEKLKLQPIILHEQPNKGRTIIEEFEDYAKVHFAIVILSPDDKGYSKDDTGRRAKRRARQNVIFGLGFFIGKLGRDHVVGLYRKDKDFELPSDFNGVMYIEYDDTGAWRYKLIDELKAAQFQVSKDNLPS